MSKVLDLLLVICFGSTSWFRILLKVLYIIGMWRVLKKCGEKSWKALIPYYRFYAIARCTGLQSEGLCYLVAGII